MPLEVWTGKKPTIRHFKVFGSLAFRHVPDQKRTKLQNKSEATIFIGHHPTGAYKLYDPIKDNVLLSRDVLVLEQENWDWNQMKTTLNRHVPTPCLKLKQNPLL